MLSLKDVDKKYENISKFKRKCIKCNHTIFIPPIRPKVICTWCGTMNYYDKKEEFKEKLKNTLKNKKNII